MITRILLLMLLYGQLAQALPADTDTLQLYVSPNGHPGWPGTLAQPLRSLQGALEKLKNHSGNQHVVIYVRGGRYRFDSSCLISKDLPFRSLLIAAYKKEKVFFDGGTKLRSSGFKKVLDKSVADRLTIQGRKHILTYDFTPELAAAAGPRQRQGFGRPVAPASMELFFNNSPLTVARWPNKGVVRIGKIIDAGANARNGDYSNRDAQFEIDFDRAERWKKATDLWLYGMFSYGWADDNLKVRSINLQTKTLQTDGAHVYSVFSSDDSLSSGIAKHAMRLRGYYVYNLLEEIDQPGEYVVDLKERKLFLWPPSDILNAEVCVSLMETPFLELINVCNVRIRDIRFQNARGMAIFIDSASGINISNCVFNNLGTVAVSLGEKLNGGVMKFNLDGSPAWEYGGQNSVRDISIENCRIYNTGSGGIILTGGNRKTLEAANNVVSNTEIHDFNRLNKSYCPAVYIGGVGNKVSHCFIYNSPHEAIHYTGNNHTVEYTHFRNVCREASDMGAIYSGRNPSARGTVIQYNYFEDIQSNTDASVCAVYVDDGSGGIQVRNNVFFRSGTPGEYLFGAIYVHGGHDNKYSNNVFVECPVAFRNNPWDQGRWQSFLKTPLMKARLQEEVQLTGPVYLQAYPELQGWPDSSTLRKNHTSNSLCIKVGKLSVGDHWDHTGVLELTTDPGFVNYSQRNFKLKSGAEVFGLLPGFVQIPFEKIGLKKNKK